MIDLNGVIELNCHIIGDKFDCEAIQITMDEYGIPKKSSSNAFDIFDFNIRDPLRVYKRGESFHALLSDGTGMGRSCLLSSTELTCL